MKRATSLALVVLVAAVFAGCKSGTAGKVISVQVTPTAVNVVISTSLQFKAVVTDTNDQVVTWTVVGGSANGTITGTGLYTAPAAVPSPALVTIMAVADKDRTISGRAQVTITLTQQPSNVTVSVSPVAPNVNAFGTQLFTAMVGGTTNTAVTWQVNRVAGGNQSLGFISAGGLYVAPGRVPTTSDGSGGTIATTFTVTAVSQADPTASGSAIVTVVPANQNAQSTPIELGTSGSNVKDSNVSGGSIACCGGTLGSLVSRGGTQYILGNTHVLARSDAAAIGEGIVQPGLIDVNCSSSRTVTVANLTQFANLETEGKTATATNVDAAIAQVVSGQVDTSGNILYLGATADSNGVPVAGAPHAGSGVAATVNMNVAKSGRSTGLTCSAVLATNVNTSVEYTQNCDGTGTPFTVHYLNQVDVAGGDFSAEGDSGSLIVTQSTADPVALLYAGSDTDTVGNPVATVLNFFASGGNSATFVGGATHGVIGCTLPNAPQSAGLKVQARGVATSAIQKAVAVRDAHVSELMAHPEVQAIGVGASYDNPAEAAIVFFVTKGMARGPIPAQVGEVRTRVVEGDLFARRGALTATETAANEQSFAAPQASYAIATREYERAKTVHAAHADEWMKQAGVQGVGVTSSVDAPGEAALMIFVIRGAQHPAIPAVIDGLRTRVRESSRFRAGNWGTEPRKACRVPSANGKTPARVPLEARRADSQL
jgi:hypothetical protein